MFASAKSPNPGRRRVHYSGGGYRGDLAQKDEGMLLTGEGNCGPKDYRVEVVNPRPR